jgi:uncharacterized membrane protein YoaK (UPF0700 family)
MNNHRAKLFTLSMVVQASLFLVALILVLLQSPPLTGGFRYSIIVVLAVAMGVQNAASRKLAVPDFTTTVLTLTIVGIGADSHLAGGAGSKGTRRVLAVVTMFLGALVGAVLVLHARDVYPVLIAFFTVAAVALSSSTLGRSHPEWR